VDQSSQSFATVLALKDGAATNTYRMDAPFNKPTGWQEVNQTKKIAGYTCRKAMAPFKGETYTVWYTTDLPFTYSPIRELLPEKGVVLAIEGQSQQYKASKVDRKPVAEATVRPSTDAQVVGEDQLKDLREKARADFRQRMMDRNLGN
jgi:GLPGLI family protein